MISSLLTRMLVTFDYEDLRTLFQSIAPSCKYSLTRPLLVVSLTFPGLSGLASLVPDIPLALGIQTAALIMMLMAFVVELLSGIAASRIKKERFSSFRLSRFSFKVFIYLVLIAVPYHWSQNYAAKGEAVMAECFDWLQNFLIIHIAQENMVSILENLAVIEGKEKSAWIESIKTKITSLWR